MRVHLRRVPCVIHVSSGVCDLAHGIHCHADGCLAVLATAVSGSWLRLKLQPVNAGLDKHPACAFCVSAVQSVADQGGRRTRGGNTGALAYCQHCLKLSDAMVPMSGAALCVTAANDAANWQWECSQAGNHACIWQHERPAAMRV